MSGAPHRSSRLQVPQWCVALAVAMLLATWGAPALDAQPVRASEDTVVVPVPPLSPRQAFLYSLAVPGYSQSILGRHKASALFITAEALSLVMIRESSANLRVAKRLQDSIPVTFVDPSTGAARVTWAPGYSPDHIRSRQQQLEDWLAVLIANHLFSAVDGFVAAHLWDVPIELAVTRGRRGTGVLAAIRW